MSEEIVLEAKSISKFFGTITALNDVNLKITKGEVLGVVGDNGHTIAWIVDCKKQER